MSCKSGLYAVNTTVGTAITNGGNYVPTTVVRKYGQNIQLSYNGVTIGNGCTGVGYYDVDVKATVTAAAADEITATLYQDGTPVPGATTTVTAGAIGDVVTLPVSALIRVCGCCGCNTTSKLTLVISGQTSTSVNLAWIVEKE